MVDTLVWGLVQGLTEFLPISSSGHLVLVPALLTRAGWEVGKPELAVSAVLHLGTLVAVLAYYRADLLTLLRARTDPEGRRIVGLLALGTVPALVGLPLEGTLDAFEDDPRNVAFALLATALILFIGSRMPQGHRRLEEGTWKDAVVVGLAQSLALVPGISRSGSTITAGVGRGLRGVEAARYSFLLAVPTIAGGGLLSLLDLGDSGIGAAPLVVGLGVSAVSGYLAIAALIHALSRIGLLPFAVYCTVVGIIGLVVL